MLIRHSLPALLTSLLLIQACASNDLDEGTPPITCDGQIASYTNHIQPIILANCAVSGCHNGDNGTQRNWTVPDNLKAKSSEVKRRILLPESHADHMPQGGTLSNEDITRLVCWVDQGAPIDN